MEFHFNKPGSGIRAQIDDDEGSGHFEPGDRIHLVSTTSSSGADPIHFDLTWDGTQWLPRLTRQQLGNGWRTLNAYYPADKSFPIEGTNFELSVATDQSEEKSYRQSDLLWASVETLYDNTNSATLNFGHQMFRVNIDLSDLTKEVTEVEVRGKCEGKRNLITQTVFPSDEETEFTWIRAYKAEDTDEIYRALLFPQTNDYTNWYEEKDLQIKVHLQTGTGVKEVIYEVPELAEMKSGRQFTVRLSEQQGDGETDPQFANKKLWVYGIHAPVCPDVIPGNGVSPGISNPEPGVWNFYRNYDNGGVIDREMNSFIPWKEGCGWYDCNKTYNTDGAEDDYMCWAATTSNLLHWWMNINQDYIALYDRKYPEMFIRRPSFVYEPGKKSEIFSFFIDVFRNRAGNTEEGVEWFLSGRPGNNLPAIEVDMTGFKGFFPEVFGGFTATSYYRGMPKKKFNKLIK